MSVNRFELFADYFQFLLMDERCEDDFASIWTPEALQLMLAVGERSISVGTLRNVNVPVEVHVLASKPELNLSGYDHASEASFSAPSGRLAVLGCTDYLPDAARIDVIPGHYQVLSVASGIDSIQTEWDPADDVYSVYLWPGTPIAPRLLKHWKAKSARQ